MSSSQEDLKSNDSEVKQLSQDALYSVTIEDLEALEKRISQTQMSGDVFTSLRGSVYDLVHGSSFVESDTQPSYFRLCSKPFRDLFRDIHENGVVNLHYESYNMSELIRPKSELTFLSCDLAYNSRRMLGLKLCEILTYGICHYHEDFPTTKGFSEFLTRQGVRGNFCFMEEMIDGYLGYVIYFYTDKEELSTKTSDQTVCNVRDYLESRLHEVTMHTDPRVIEDLVKECVVHVEVSIKEGTQLKETFLASFRSLISLYLGTRDSNERFAQFDRVIGIRPLTIIAGSPYTGKSTTSMSIDGVYDADEYYKSLPESDKLQKDDHENYIITGKVIKSLISHCIEKGYSVLLVHNVEPFVDVMNINVDVVPLMFVPKTIPRTTDSSRLMHLAKCVLHNDYPVHRITHQAFSSMVKTVVGQRTLGKYCANMNFRQLEDARRRNNISGRITPFYVDIIDLDSGKPMFSVNSHNLDPDTKKVSHSTLFNRMFNIPFRLPESYEHPSVEQVMVKLFLDNPRTSNGISEHYKSRSGRTVYVIAPSFDFAKMIDAFTVAFWPCSIVQSDFIIAGGDFDFFPDLFVKFPLNSYYTLYLNKAGNFNAHDSPLFKQLSAAASLTCLNDFSNDATFPLKREDFKLSHFGYDLRLYESTMRKFPSVCDRPQRAAEGSNPFYVLEDDEKIYRVTNEKGRRK